MNEAKRAREEEMFDLKMLEDSLISFQSEDIEREKRKVFFRMLYLKNLKLIVIIVILLKQQELLVEQQRYRQYLKEQYEAEKRAEKEIDSIISEEIERQMQKRLNQWKAEKAARKAMQKEVVNVIKQQIQEKSKFNLTGEY